MVVVLASAGQSGFAQSAQASSTVSLRYLNIQSQYPSEVLPGASATIHVQATARSAFELLSLTAQIYYVDGTSLLQLATSTLASNSYMRSGDSLSRDIQVSIPQDAPRTSLMAAFSEKVQVPYTDYSYYYYPYYLVNYSSYHYGYYYYYPYYYPAYYAIYPSYSYASTTDDGIAPLSYIKATTPEYQALQQQFNQTQAENQKLQQQLTQLQSQNQQLQQNLQNAQNINSQQNSTIADLRQELDSSKVMTQNLQTISVALAIAVFVVAVVSIALRRGRNTSTSEAKQSVAEEKKT